jgi:hypothetical protein
MLDNNNFVNEAELIVAKAQEVGVTLRILGSTAFRIHSPEYVSIHSAMNRPMTDIDLMAYSKQIRQIEAFFSGTGYEMSRAALTPELFATRRIFNHQEKHFHVDIFLDELSMCHKIPFKNRLEIDYPTIPLAEMVLEKMQIATLADKDEKDILILLAAHRIGDHDHDTINGNYIASLISDDWGFYYTIKLNIQKVRKGLTQYHHLFKETDIQNIDDRLNQLESFIEQVPKSWKWKARAAIGPRVRWYNEVDEVERAAYLSDIKKTKE